MFSSENLQNLIWASNTLNEVLNLVFEDKIRYEVAKEEGHDPSKYHYEGSFVRGEYIVVEWSNSLQEKKSGFAYSQKEILDLYKEWEEKQNEEQENGT